MTTVMDAARHMDMTVATATVLDLFCRLSTAKTLLGLR